MPIATIATFLWQKRPGTAWPGSIAGQKKELRGRSSYRLAPDFASM